MPNDRLFPHSRLRPQTYSLADLATQTERHLAGKENNLARQPVGITPTSYLLPRLGEEIGHQMDVERIIEQFALRQVT